MRRFKNRQVLCFGAVCFLGIFGATGLYGQGAATASMSGRVTDATNSAIPETAVTIRNTGTSASRTITTDPQGRYDAPDLAIGTYEITAMKMGFQTGVRSGVTLTVGSAPVVDFQLAVG